MVPYWDWHVGSRWSNAMITVCRRYTFEAAHHLRGVVPPEHKCHRIHGHSYELEVKVTGPVENGMVHGLEFDVIDAVAHALIKMVDHRTLNDVPGLEVPTIENIAPWFANAIAKGLQCPVTVRIYEGPRSWAEFST
jgi:6-pyruvoyltetrahydropterin/6-carboxytetrahydropterin synthase